MLIDALIKSTYVQINYIIWLSLTLDPLYPISDENILDKNNYRIIARVLITVSEAFIKLRALKQS